MTDREIRGLTERLVVHYRDTLEIESITDAFQKATCEAVERNDPGWSVLAIHRERYLSSSQGIRIGL